MSCFGNRMPGIWCFRFVREAQRSLCKGHWPAGIGSGTYNYNPIESWWKVCKCVFGVACGAICPLQCPEPTILPLPLARDSCALPHRGCPMRFHGGLKGTHALSLKCTSPLHLLTCEKLTSAGKGVY